VELHRLPKLQGKLDDSGKKNELVLVSTFF
jgi:hypothetical protein